MMRVQVWPLCTRNSRIVQHEWEQASEMRDGLLSSQKLTVRERTHVSYRNRSAWTYTHSDFHIIKDLLVFFQNENENLCILAYSRHFGHLLSLCPFAYPPQRSFLSLSQLLSSCPPSPYLSVSWGHGCECFSPGGGRAKRVAGFHFFIHTQRESRICSSMSAAE